MDIGEFIPVGYENAVERIRLAQMLEMDDRTMRDAISHSNFLIINMQDGRGYFRPADDEDALVRKWLKMCEARRNEEERRVEQASEYLAGR